MGKTPIYLPVFIDEWRGSPRVAELEAAKNDGVYLSILMLQMQRGRVPTDLGKLAELIRRPLEDVRATWAVVGDLFEVDDAGAYAPRTEEARRRLRATTERASKAAQKRWNGHSMLEHRPSICLEPCLPDASQAQVKKKTSVSDLWTSPEGLKEQGERGGPGEARKRAMPRKLGSPSQVEKAVEGMGEGFRLHWERWERHRREIKKALTPTQAEAQLKRFAGMGLERACAAIDYTVAQGWQGLREPETNGRGGALPEPVSDRETQAELERRARHEAQMERFRLEAERSAVR